MQIYNRPLAILPSQAQAFARQIESFLSEPAEASRFVGARAAGSAYRTTESGTAIISITAPLVNRLSGMWGVVSYEYLGTILDAAANDKTVNAIVLDFDSPGGEAVGSFEIAAQVRKVNATKPVHATINGLCCSAAYAIASGAKTITATESSIIGSVGVVALHLDASRMLDKAGVTPTLIFAGAHKVDGNPLEPLSEDAHSTLQSEVDKFYGMFVDAVGAGRGARMSAEAARKTEARTYIGAEAVSAGLVDSIGSFADVIAETERSARIAAATRRIAAQTPKPKTAEEERDEYIAKLNASVPGGTAADRWAATHARLKIKTRDPGPVVETNHGWDQIVAEQKARNRR